MKVDGWCPYCGSGRLETAYWAGGTYWAGGKAYFVRCLDCRATGPSVAQTEQEAIELFNRRADGPRQMRLGI